MKNSISTEIEDALKIARSTRESILSAITSLENHLLGFYTVVQILERKDDFPEYRKSLYGVLRRGEVLLDIEGKHDALLTHSFYDSIPKLEHILKLNQDRILYGVNNSDIEIATKLGVKCDKSCHIDYPRVELSRIIGSVKLELIRRLNDMINELTYGEIPEYIFEQIRGEVDSKLATLCPKAIEKLPIVYSQLSSDTPIVYSEIASVCRRIIKDVADVLFPPIKESVTDVQGNEHPTDENAYVNRILAYVKQKINSDSEKKLFSSMFEYVEGFLYSINHYASKGDHSDFTRTDAVRCIVYTYLLLGDILHYYANKK